MSSWHETTIPANKIELHVWRTGGAKPPMLLLHGLTDHGRCWSEFARNMENDYDLIMVDQRGHGRSSAPEHGYQTVDRGQDALALLDALEIEQAVVVGHSMGGEVAAWLAANAPDRVRAAVLEDPPFWNDDRPQGLEAAQNWASGLRADQALGYERLQAKGHAENPLWSDQVVAPWAESKLQANERIFSWIAHRTDNWRDFLSTINVPTMLVTGETERGAIISQELAQGIAAMSPSIATVQILGAGHCIRYDQPELYVAAVRDFLSGLE